MLFGESARFGTRGRWIAGTSMLALLGVGLFLAGLTKERRFSVPRRGMEPGAPSRMRPVVETDESRVAANFGNLPLSFEPNQGQTDSQVKFFSRNSHYNLFLTSSEAVFTLPVHSSTKPRSHGRAAQADRIPMDSQAVLRMEILRASPTPQVEGDRQIEGHTNYLTGRDSGKWVRDVPQYARVNYRGIYPGVDLTFYGEQRQLEFDFVVKPGASPATIALGIEGARKIRTDKAGDLVLTLAAGDLRMHKPVAYQKQEDVRQPVDARFVVKGAKVALAVGAYDRNRELVIDPSIAYSTFLGAGNEDDGFGIAVDSAGAAYVTGQTLSTGFPKTTGSAQTAFTGKQDAFVSKLRADGTGLVYSTFLGGSIDSTGAAGSALSGGNAIAIDTLGKAYIVGSTTATDFPTSLNAAQGSNHGLQDAFVAVLNASGNTLVYSTYLGGSSDEIGFGVAVDALGGIYAVGETKSTDLPLQSALQGSNHSTAAGGSDGFITKLNPNGTLAFEDYLGGAANDVASGVAVDASNNFYVSGITLSTNFPTSGSAFQPTCGSCPSNNTVQHAFVTAIPASLVPSYLYSTYLHGSGTDVANLIAVDALSNAYVVGLTASSDFPTTTGAFQTHIGAGAASNAFITKLNPAGSALVYSTYLGGSGSDDGLAIALDTAANAYVTGLTTSSNFPTSSPVQPTLAGGADAFVTKLNAAGSALLFSTYLGGTKDENATKIAGIAVDTQSPPNIYVTGGTGSKDFPITAGSVQPAYSSSGDVFVVKYSPQTLASQFTISVAAVSPTAISRGSTGTSTVTVTSTGFVGDVPLSCSITPTTGTPPTCSVTSPVNLPSNGSVSSPPATLTITTVKSALTPSTGAALWLPIPGLALVGAGLLSGPRRKGKLLGILLGGLAFTGLLLIVACGSGTFGGGGGGGGTTTGSYTVTVRGGVNGTPGTATFSVQ